MADYPDYAYDREWGVMPEQFVDELFGTIKRGGGRRRLYRQARNRALSAYGPMGFAPEVTVRPAQASYPPGTPTSTIYQDVAALDPGQIALRSGSLHGSESGWGTVDPTTTRGLMAIQPPLGPIRRPRQRRQYRRSTTRLLSHELGHVLGLDHTMDPTSVMGSKGGPLPSSRDLSLLSGPDTGLPDPGDPGYVAPAARRRRKRRG